MPPGSIFFENLFPPTAGRGEGKYDLLNQNSFRNMKKTWNIRLSVFCMICYIFKM